MVIRQIRIIPAVLGIAKDHSLDSIVRAVVGESVIATLAASEERSFPILREGEAPKRRALILISWRKASSLWLPQFPMMLRVSGNDLEQMAHGL